MKVSQQTNVVPIKFKFEFLRHITKNFSQKIGHGGYGEVYKGEHDGTMIAVKKLKNFTGFGDQEFQECMNHMRVQHQNIVRLIGYCYKIEKEVAECSGKLVFADEQERVLCLEYMDGGNLHVHLSDKPCVMDWRICYRIIKGTCEGLKYLHEGCKIYHLDLKPQNILLDINKIPKIGDFGLSKVLGSTVATWNTQTFAGTFGYMPPEYIHNKELSEKFDVFSLGVIIIQIMAGFEGRSQFENMTSQEVIDLVHGHWENKLQGTTSSNESLEVKTCIEIALSCVEHDKNKRPTIINVVEKLNEIDSTNTINSSKVQATDYRSLRDANEHYGSNSDNGGVTVQVPAEDEELPSSEFSSLLEHSNTTGNQSTLSHRNTRHPIDMHGSSELNHSTSRTTYSANMFWHPILRGAFLAAVFYLAVFIFILLRYVLVPEVTADIEDARLNSFVLSTTTASSLLAYNISVAVSVGNPDVVMSFTYTKALVATITFHDQRLYYNSSFTYEGQRQARRSNEVYILRASGKVTSDVLGAAAVEEFKKQNAAGVFTLEVRLSGEIRPGFTDTRKFSLSCPLWLRLAPPPPVMVAFRKVNCVPANLGDKYF